MNKVVAAIAGLALGFVFAWILRKPDAAALIRADRERERTATVVLSKDSEGKFNGIAKVVSDDPKDPDRIHVKKAPPEHVHWVTDPPSADVRMTIEIKDTSTNPFDGGFETVQNKHVYSKSVSPKAKADTDYFYTVRVFFENQVFNLDPPIRVDP